MTVLVSHALALALEADDSKAPAVDVAVGPIVACRDRLEGRAVTLPYLSNEALNVAESLGAETDSRIVGAVLAGFAIGFDASLNPVNQPLGHVAVPASNRSVPSPEDAA